MNSLARKHKLTKKQFDFVKIYLGNKNKGSAWAYAKVYNAKNKKIANSNAGKLLGMEKIRAYISEIESKIEQKLISRVVATRERIIDEESCIAFLDPKDLFDDDGRLLPVKNMPEHVRRAIASFKIKSKEIGSADELTAFDILSEFKLLDKGKALDRLEKVFGMQRETIDIGVDGFRALLEEIDGKTRGVLPSDRDE